MKCVYCIRDLSENMFTREHVFPESFGVFRDNFTLLNKVCHHCNQYFGNILELNLARDSLEGIKRYDFKINRSKEIKNLGRKSGLVIKVAEGILKGAYAFLTFSPEQDKPIIKPLPQVGFRKIDSGEYVFYPLWKIPRKAELNESEFDANKPKGILILGCKVEEAEKKLDEKGFKIKFGEEAQSGLEKANNTLECKIEWPIDDTIRRAVAKIAFNYLAFWEGVKFVLNEKFDPIRRYIRWGEKIDYPFVLVDSNPILADEPKAGRSRLGHVITINWASDNFSILSQISVLNLLRYRVSLAKNFTSLYRPLRIERGHFFNIASGDILELNIVHNIGVTQVHNYEIEKD
jgi:hypothetical protein